MRKLSLPAQAFLCLVVAVGAVLAALFARLPPLHGPTLFYFIALTLTAVVTSAVKLHLPTTRNKATMSPSFFIDFASLLLLGPRPTIFVAAAGAFSQSVVGSRRSPVHRTLFNVACFVITVTVAGGVFEGMGGSTGTPTWPHDITPLAAATTTYFLVNSGLVAVIISLVSGKSPIGVWRHSFLWSGPYYFVGAAMAAMLTTAIAHHLWSFLPVVAVPMYLTYWGYCVYSNRLQEEHRHREIIESLNEGMAVVDRQGIVRLWNDALERIAGVDRDRAEGHRFLDVTPGIVDTELPATIEAALASHEPRVIENFVFGRASDRRVLQVRIFPYVGGVTMFWNDVTARAAAEEALRCSEERYALAASGANDGLWDWDLLTGQIHFSARWRSMVGLADVAGSAHPDEWLSRVHPDDRTGLKAALDAHVSGDTVHFQHEHRLLHADGSYRWMLCKGAAVRLANGTATRLAGSLTDVTERAQTQEQLRRAAQHDALTDLPNRALFVDLLGHALDRARRQPDRPCAVFFLDIDRFKVINDSLGHQIGDELLVAISRRLQNCVRDGDIVARLGGDEFTVLLNDLPDIERARVVAQRILESIQAPLSLGGREIFTSTSIGIAISTPAYASPDEIMRDADSAMYRAKTRGKARFEIFDAEMHAQAMDRLGLENDLRRAVERRELSLHYQPIVSLSTGHMVGVEALLRWNRGGVPVAPTTFIPMAEEIGIIEPLGAWVLHEACRQFSTWQARMGDDAVAGITVNVSTRQLVQPGFAAVVKTAVLDARMNPSALHLEITETALLKSPDVVEDALRELRAFGVRIFLDDFGTGFSSLSHLHKLPVDALKIDRSFVASLMQRDRPAIVESILALARTLGTPVIAEGVETEDQLRELVRLGCAQAQGAFFSMPLAAVAVDAYVAAQRKLLLPLSGVLEAARTGAVEPRPALGYDHERGPHPRTVH